MTGYYYVGIKVNFFEKCLPADFGACVWRSESIRGVPDKRRREPRRALGKADTSLPQTAADRKDKVD